MSLLLLFAGSSTASSPVDPETIPETAMYALDATTTYDLDYRRTYEPDNREAYPL